MTDFIEQELLVDSPVFIDGALSVPNGEHTLAAIGDIDLPDQAALDGGGDLARSPISSAASQWISNGLDWPARSGRRRLFIWQPHRGYFHSLSLSP